MTEFNFAITGIVGCLLIIWAALSDWGDNNPESGV